MMKYILLALVLGLAGTVQGQADTISSPYQKFPNNIPLQLLLTDSVTTYTSESLPASRPFMVMLFSPECDHCKKATRDIIDNITLFDGVDIIMATPLPFGEMKKFYEDFQLERFPNIRVGRDQRFLLPTYYAVKYLPFHAFYAKKKKLIGVSPEGLTAAQMAAKFNH